MAIKPYFTYGAYASDRDLITSTTKYAGTHKRYFSSIDAEIFLGQERILDIAAIDFMYEEKKMPYYGFNNFVPSKMFVGQKIVQGTFMINFTETGYIAKLLQKIEASKLADKYDMLSKSCGSEDAPLFDKQFDILVGYGGYNVANEASLNNTHLVIQGASITSFQQILDASGNPVMETYSFIAKSIKFDGYKYKSNAVKPPVIDTPPPTVNTNNKRSVEIAEKRIQHDAKELTEKCNNYPNILGLIVNVIHSLHKKNDNKSHIYVDFEKQLNSDKDNKLAFSDVKLVISDNSVDIPLEYTLKHTPNTIGHFGVLINETETSKIKKKLNQPSKQVVSCEITYNVILNGELQNPRRFNVGMIKGLNY